MAEKEIPANAGANNVANTAGGIPFTTNESAGTASARPPTKPSRIHGKYPVRSVTYYQFNSSDIRSIGVAQAAATILFSLGTAAFFMYLDFSKDIAMATQAKQLIPQFLQDLTSYALAAWKIFWIFGALSFGWQGLELRRIKREHGEVFSWKKLFRR